jgi:hypothetical protein
LAGLRPGDGWRVVQYGGSRRYPNGGGLTAAERASRTFRRQKDRTHRPDLFGLAQQELNSHIRADRRISRENCRLALVTRCGSVFERSSVSGAG